MVCINQGMLFQNGMQCRNGMCKCTFKLDCFVNFQFTMKLGYSDDCYNKIMTIMNEYDSI